MTARRDEVQTARDARRAGQTRAAQIAGELSSLPGWLLIGDSNRLADPAQKTTAQHGAELLAQLGDTHHGLLALDEELDALDGARPQSIYLFLEWTRWLEQVPDAATLLAELVPDPRRLFLGAEPRMTEATAQRIVETVAANGGHVGDGDTFVRNARLADDDVFDLNHTALTRLDPLVAGQAVGVLLPLRLETRFRRPNGGPWKLRVRVYPDPVALAPPAPTPTRAEADLVAACWTQADGGLTTDAGEAAFRSLASSVGGARAAYLLRTVPVVPEGAGFAAPGDYRAQGILTNTYSAALPEVLSLWGDVGNGLQLLGELHPDLEAIAAQADITNAMAGLEPDRVPELWWTSYQKALDVGLAVEVEIPDGPAGPPGPAGPHLEVVLVTGLSDQDPRALFERHADRGSLGVVNPMSPTNTVAGAPAADLGRDPATWLAVVQAGGGGTFAGLAAPLTGAPLLNGVADAELGGLLDAVSPLVTALWPVIWQRRLKDVENAGIDVLAMGGWAARVLCPLGPYAALRVGDIPYGVLPAVDVPAWGSRPSDPAWEHTLLTILAGGALSAWAAAGVAGGTAAGADVDGLLEIIGRVPTARAPGSQLLLPLELVALLRAVVFGESPQDVLDRWRTDGAAVLGISPEPLHRYQAFGYVQPAVRGHGGVRNLLRRYLQMSWEELAYGGHQVADTAPFLVRLLRHSLLVTQAEVSRLDPDHWPAWTPPYRLSPVAAPEQLANDASHGGRVDQLPDYAQAKLDEQYPPDPRVLAIVRQFLDVREAVRELSGLDDALLEGGSLAPAVAAVLDTSSHRIDPWITAVGTRRLRRLTARGVRRRLGAYGWVDDLSPATDPTPPTTAGLLHAPGPAQALAAAVLRDHAVHDDDARWQITARSDLVRLAARLGADVRLGVHLSEALGREIERRAGDPAAVLTLRRNFPPRPEQAGRRVCDGLQVLDADPGDLPAEVGQLDDLRHALDTYGDLLVADAVHDVVSGRGAQAQESMEAAAGLGAPPELRLLRTQRQGASVRTTVLVALPMPDAAGAGSAVATADPALAALVEAEAGPASAWAWTREGRSVSLDELGLGVPDVVLIAQAQLDAHAGSLLGGPPTGGTTGARRQALDRLCSLVGAQRGLPAVAGDTAGATAELRVRLAALRAAAATVVAELGASPPVTAEARRWGLPDDPAAAIEVLQARLGELGDPASDASADAPELSERIRTLLAPVSGLPVICTGVLPATTAAPGLDRDWLEIVAAVRPALARLEAHQLHREWPAAASAPDRLWSVPDAGAQQVIVYGPGVGAPGPTAVALLDDWAETVPSSRHTTHAAFGFDAPRARAAQAILLAVPPDEQVALSADALPGIVLSTRAQTHARMAQPDQLGAWSLAVPTSMILAGGRAGSDLVGP